ncbi:MAG: ABC transporter permease [Elusimicrobia bacterium]|nr:ABC transporter permease [Elusimicrobiota bacterium]
MLLLAWRNLWRNARRSLLTLASIACGVAAIMFGQSMIKTIQWQLIEKATGIITGHLRVQNKEVKELKFPEKNYGDLPKLEKILAGDPDIEAYEHRILLTGLVSGKNDSNGVLLCGVEPKRDPKVTTMSTYLAQGSWLKGDGKEIVMGDQLADALGAKLGESIVVLAQASDGSMGADNYKIVGLFHAGSQTFDKAIAFVPLAAFQETLAMEGRANDLVIKLRDPERLEEARSRLSAALAGEPLKVLTWREVDEEITGVQAYQNAILKIVLGIVFLIVALGILNTVFMSLFERVREFGILKAMGARPSFVLRLVLVESCMLGGLGGGLGVLTGVGLIAYYRQEGLPLPIGEAMSQFLPFDTILHLRFDWPTHQTAIAAVVVTSLLAALPPALRAAKLKPVDCLRHR